VEKEIVITLGEEEYKIWGFIDRLAYNLETGEYEVHDYKTANSLPSKERIESDRQLALYSIAVKQIFGNDKEVKLIWHFLAYNKKIEIKKTDEEIEKVKEKTISAIKEIISAKEFPPKKSRLCDWCEFKDICPAWGNSLEKQREKEKENIENYPFLKKFIKE
jgi:RecB family exonuclease